MCDAGGGAYQTLLKRVPAPGYPSRPDIAVHAVTIQVPLEGSLLTGGIAFVLKTGQQQWLACRAEGVLRSDFFISTQQVQHTTALCSVFTCLSACLASVYRPVSTPQALSHCSAAYVDHPVGCLSACSCTSHSIVVLQSN